MEKYIGYKKLSKKKQREIDQKKRGIWYGVNPATRKPENSKAYNRSKVQDWKKDSGAALFSILTAKTQEVLLATYHAVQKLRTQFNYDCLTILSY